MIKIDSFIKKNGSNSSSTNGGGFANGATTNTTTVQKELETHKLWGQNFNGTQDVDGDMTVNGNVSISGNVKATTGAITNIESKSITNVGTITTDTVDATTIKGANANISNQLNIKDIISKNITTDYLTVTKSAHFWELVVDKISSTKGAIIVSPANCIIEDLTNNNGQYTLYWRAEDVETGKAITNDFKVNDQIICQSFNAATDADFNVSNKFYWRLVTNVGRTYRADSLRGGGCYWNYIQLSATDANGTSIPEIGDNIAVLGNRTNEDRQNAIIISSTNSDYLDAEVQAPSIVQYKGIKSYDLKSYRYNVIAANGNTFVGNFKVVADDGSLGDIESGKDGKGIKSIVTHYLASNLKSGMGQTTVWDSGSVIPPTLTVTKPYMWQQAKTTYTDDTYTLSLPVMIGALGKTGANGKDGKIYILESTPSTIILNSDGSFNRDNQYSSDPYMIVKGYEIVDGKRNNLFTVNGNPITVRLSFNNDNMYTEYTTDDYVQCDFEPKWTDSYYSILAEIKQNGLKNARAIMYEGVEYRQDKILATLDIPIVKLPFNGIMDKLSMTKARATVNINDDLYVFNEGYVNHIDGDRITRVTDLSKYYIKLIDSNGRTVKNTPSADSNTFWFNSLWQSKYSEQTNRITHFRLQLYDTSDNLLDEITYNVTFDAGAVLTVGQNAITSSVQQSKTYTDGQISTVKQTAESITSTVSSMKDEIIGANCMLGLNGQGWSSNTIYEDAGNSFHCESTDWFQSHPIEDFSGDYTFSFDFWAVNSGNLQIKILDFTQTYYDDGIYNQYVDFGTYTPCKILTTSSYVSNVTLTNYATRGTSSTWSYTNTETITLKVGDNVAVRVTNSTNNRYNSIYGTVSAINISSKSVTVQAIALLDQPNTICTLSCPTDKKDGTDINSLHYDEKLGRYWIRFKETRGTAKTFVMLFRNLSTSSIGWISRLMLEESVEYPHKYNNTGQASQSMIKQTANEILMSVNDTYLKIGDGNITLNGDTKVNGSLTLNDENQGFLLFGDSGTTEISPKSIGTYNEFKSKTTNIIKTHYNSTIYGSPTVDGALYGFSWNVSQKLGTFKKGSYINLIDYTNVAFANVGMEQIGIGTPSATFYIHENGTLTKTITVGDKTSVDIGNYTVVGDNVEVMVTGRFTKNVSTSIWGTSQDILSPRDTNITIKPIRPMPSISVTVDWKNEVPTASAFMLIGYDGFAVNFGNNKTVYCGKDGFIAKYGNNEFRITDAGISHNNMATTYTIIGSSSSSSPTTYTVQDPIDTVLCKSGYCKVIFPSNPYNGQRIKIYDKSSAESYINSNGKHVCRCDSIYDDRSIWTNQNLRDMAVRIYTYINDTWFEEYTG